MDSTTINEMRESRQDFVVVCGYGTDCVNKIAEHQSMGCCHDHSPLPYLYDYMPGADFGFIAIEKPSLGGTHQNVESQPVMAGTACPTLYPWKPVGRAAPAAMLAQENPLHTLRDVEEKGNSQAGPAQLDWRVVRPQRLHQTAIC